MPQFAVLIGCETYGDASLPKVDYAAADVAALGEALARHAFAPAEQTILVDAKASKSVVESRLRKVLRAAKAGDAVYLYFAGHAFAFDGASYLACGDTTVDDLAETSLALDSLIAEIERSAAGKLVLFLDASSAALVAAEEFADRIADWDDAPLRTVFDGAASRACFLSCTPGEPSRPAGAKKHGAWAFHLLEALNGEAPTAAEKGGAVTCATLLRHLKTAVPRTLRTAFADKKKQTPVLFGGDGGRLAVADVASLAAPKSKKKAEKKAAGDTARVALVRERIESVKKLSGFRKGARIPDVVNAATQKMAAQWALEELQADLDKVHAELRDAFKFKRLDLQVDGPIDGSGTIITPGFSYSYGVRLNPRDPSEVIWRREVVDLADADQAASKPFAAVFEEAFDTVSLAPSEPLDVAALIDRIEALEDPRVSLDYDRETTWCKITIRGISGEIKVTKSTFDLVQSKPTNPKKLLEAFFAIQQMLAETGAAAERKPVKKIAAK